MKKVRVIKEMPFVKVGMIFDVKDGHFDDSVHNGNTLPVLYDRKGVRQFIEDGWLEEVVENKSLKEKFRNARPFMTDNVRTQLAHIAMLHAVEVAEKAIKEYDPRHSEPNCKGLKHFIIDALEKEAELNKTKES